MDLSRFSHKISDAGYRLTKMSASINYFYNENSELIKMVLTGEDVPACDFLTLYDTRTYDVHSRQNDIKFMKELDFQGIYLIRNVTKKKYYIGRGDHVFQKVYKHLNGSGHKDIYSDYTHRNKIIVNFFKLEVSGFENLNELDTAVRDEFQEELNDYKYYTTSSTTQTEKTKNTSQKKQSTKKSNQNSMHTHEEKPMEKNSFTTFAVGFIIISIMWYLLLNSF